MKLSKLLCSACSLTGDARVLIITDEKQIYIAKMLKYELADKCDVFIIPSNSDDSGGTSNCSASIPNYMFDGMRALRSSDLLLVILSLDTFICGANRVFSPFSKPNGLISKYAFVRLDISAESLCEGLSTPPDLINAKLREMERFSPEREVNVRNAAGTNVRMRVSKFTTCSHFITEDGGFAFLPPSETSSNVLPHTANGRIAVDVTIGQLYHYGKLLGWFGRVPSPVILEIADGRVTDIYGNAMADELKSKLFILPPECRELVELGQGLSLMRPTGLIGVDESIITTCHFGIGDSSRCGLHLDVVIHEPTISNTGN